jgi:hypothetical protein
MTIQVGMAGAIIAGILLAGCATTAKTTATAANDSTCLTGTGSRIPVGDGKCSDFGRSYTNQDIKETGASTTGEALQLLGPPITVHR